MSIKGEAVGESWKVQVRFRPFPPHGSASSSSYPTPGHSSGRRSLSLSSTAATSPWPAASSRGLLASVGPPGSSSASAKRLPDSLPSAAAAPALASPAPVAVTGASCSTQGFLSPWGQQIASSQVPMQPEAVCS